MVSINGIGVRFGATPLLKDVSFIINKGEKVALTGRNGAGKSTLLKIIAKEQMPTSGNISRQNDLTIGYLPQQMPISDTTTLLEETRKAYSETLKIKEELDEYMTKLGELESLPEDQQIKILEKIDDLTHKARLNYAAGLDAEAEQMLSGLGFTRNDFNRPTSTFSGGWRMRIELAKILLKKPDLLLLDEPTNHLDIESIQWLEKFLKDKKKTLILVSHDKAFLDNVTTRTIELNCGRNYDYKVNYSKFVELREERLEQQKKAYENQQKEIADIKDFIERFRYKPTKAVQVQSRIKQLEKIVPIEIDEVDRSHLSLKFPPVVRSGDYPVIIENVAKNYGELNVFNDVEFMLKRGDKVAFVGKNGEGKTTLVKCIMNEVDYTGNLKLGHNVTIGYFAQNAASMLDPNITVYDTVDNIATGEIRTRLKDLLGAFLFRGADVDKKVSVLSGGEKTRLALLKLLLQPANLLIMDEPTNHLDIATKEILKQALINYDGTLILVSHDRDFLDGLVEKVYEFKDKKVKEHLGGIYEFLESKGVTDMKGIEMEESDIKRQHIPEDKTVDKGHGKEEYLRRKEAERQKKRAEKQIAKIENEITEYEGLLKELENCIAGGDNSANILQEYEKIKIKLDTAMEQWEKAQIEESI